MVLQIFGLLGTWKYWKFINFEFWWTWEYWSSRYLGSWEPGNSVPHPILVSPERGNSGPQICGVVGTSEKWSSSYMGSCREHSGQEPFLEYVPENMTSLFLNIGQVLIFLKDGSPGQTTMPARRGSKNCVETRSQSPESSHMSPDAA